jgi:hypothetical protein
MKTRPLIPVCVLLALTSLSAREFTDTQGRKLEAEIVSATMDQVTLRRAADGKTVTTYIKVFSAEDQQFIHEFARANVKYSFEVRYEKKKKDEQKVSAGGTQGTLENWYYAVSLRNISVVDAEDVSVSYSIYMKAVAEKGRMGARIVGSGTTKLDKVARNATSLFETGTVEVARMRPMPGYVFRSGEGSKSDQLAGFALKLMKDGKEIFSYATDRSFIVSSSVK